MDREFIQKELTQKRQTLDALEGEIATAERELESRMETFSRLQGEYIGQAKKPASLLAQKRRISDVQADIAGLTRLKERNEKEIQTLERDLSLCRLHDDQVTRFHQSLSRCQAAMKILEHAEILSQQFKAMTGAVKTLFSETEVAVESLASAYKKLPPGYSLQSFLSGELLIIEPGAEDRDAILDRIGNELKGLARTELSVDLRAVERLAEAARLYSQWRVQVNEFASGRDLCLTRTSLRPRLVKPVTPGQSMAPPDYSDVIRRPANYSPTDHGKARRAAGIPDTSPFGDFYSGGVVAEHG